MSDGQLKIFAALWHDEAEERTLFAKLNDFSSKSELDGALEQMEKWGVVKRDAGRVAPVVGRDNVIRSIEELTLL